MRGLVLSPPERHRAHRRTAKFDLTLCISEGENGLEVSIEYSTELFLKSTMERLLEHYRVLLEEAVAAPDTRISDLPLLSPKANVCSSWNGPGSSTPWRRGWSRFTGSSRPGPVSPRAHRVAVREEGRSWSYAELDSAARRLASHLQAEGVGRGDVVVIWARRSASLVWALLGVVEAGAAFAILDPAYPAPRLLACASQVNPRAWIDLAGAGEPTGDLAALRSRVACHLDLPDGIGGDGPWDGQPVEESAGAAPDPSARAYVAFTSGTTGVPKAIVGSPHGLPHFLRWQRERWDLAATDRFSMLSGLAHDPLLRDIFAPLTLGAALLVPDRTRIVGSRAAAGLALGGGGSRWPT